MKVAEEFSCVKMFARKKETPGNYLPRTPGIIIYNYYLVNYDFEWETA
jgi:hypothetical protein